MKKRATYELWAIVKALSLFPALNTPEEDLRLKMALDELERRKRQRYS